MSNLEFKKLKINPRFEKFSPIKKQDEMELLEKSLKEKGYIGAPILMWRGFIADGHNRYRVCEKYNIPFETEELDLGDNVEEIDVMDWMLTHQLSSKNLTAGEKLAMMAEFKEEVKAENEKKKEEANRKFYGNRFTDNVESPPNGGQSNQEKSRDTFTDNVIAKRIGIGTGTVARYNKVMNSDDEELKEKVKTGKVKIGTAYREIKEKEQPKKENISNSFKSATDEYIGTQNSGHFGEYFNEDKTTDKTFTNEDVVNAYKDSKTLKNAIDMLDIKDEFETFKEEVTEKLETYSNRLFSVYSIQERITEEERDFAIGLMYELMEDIKKIVTQIKGE